MVRIFGFNSRIPLSQGSEVGERHTSSEAQQRQQARREGHEKDVEIMKHPQTTRTTTSRRVKRHCVQCPKTDAASNTANPRYAPTVFACAGHVLIGDFNNISFFRV